MRLIRDSDLFFDGEEMAVLYTNGRFSDDDKELLIKRVDGAVHNQLHGRGQHNTVVFLLDELESYQCICQ